MKLSLIIPTYNESETIMKTLDLVHDFLPEQDYEHEIIVVNDGSQDNSKALLDEWCHQHPRYSQIYYPKNQGKGYAILQGIRKSTGTIIGFMDADASVDIHELPPFLTDISTGLVDLGIASLVHPDSQIVLDNNPQWRKIVRHGAKTVLKKIFELPVYDTQRGFKFFSRDLAILMMNKQKERGFVFDIELLLLAHLNNYTIKEYPITWNNPKSPHINIQAYFSMVIRIISVWWRMVRGYYKINRS